MAEPAPIVLDASAMVETLIGGEHAAAVRSVIDQRALIAPSHFDVEVFSAIGRLQRAGELTEPAAAARIEKLADAPVERVHLPQLLIGAWRRRHNTSLADALYVELANEFDTVVVTVDRRLAQANPTLALVPAE